MVDIMGVQIVDVRGMLCAQALAVVAQAAGKVAVGDVLEVLLDAEDVRRDLIVWAKGRGLRVREMTASTLQIA